MRHQAFRYRAGGPAPQEQNRRLRCHLEFRRHHWGIWCKVDRWVYCARVVWR